ncbi:MAG TPA: hypothetical protein VGE50_13725 [Gammaproteobacteria bacterium]
MRVDKRWSRVRWIAAGVLLLGATVATAGTWMRSEDESYYSMRLEYETADTLWNKNWERESMPCTANNWKLSQIYEYGLSYYHTAFGTLDLLDRNCDGYDVSGLGDLELGIRSRLDIFRNGRTWEVAAILPSGYSTSGKARLGNDRFGLRLGAFGRFAGQPRRGGEEGVALELGGNLHIWEGDASEQLSASGKVTLPVWQRSRLFGALEGDYALINRHAAAVDTSINPPIQYGYDKLTGRLGFTTKISRSWSLTLEGASVIIGRNTSDANTFIVGISRDFRE